MVSKISPSSLYGWVSVYTSHKRRVKKVEKEKVSAVEKTDSGLYKDQKRRQKGIKISIFV